MDQKSKIDWLFIEFARGSLPNHMEYNGDRLTLFVNHNQIS